MMKQQLAINQSNQGKVPKRTSSKQKLQKDDGLKKNRCSDLINIKYICESDKVAKCIDDNPTQSDMDNGNEKTSRESSSVHSKVNPPFLPPFSCLISLVK